MKVPPLYMLVQQALIGLVYAAVASGIWWLATGSLPDGMELWTASFTLSWAGSAFLCMQRAREVRVLREMYGHPAADEK